MLDEMVTSSSGRCADKNTNTVVKLTNTNPQNPMAKPPLTSHDLNTTINKVIFTNVKAIKEK